MRILRSLNGREATLEERAAMARWSGWGAVPAVFDPSAAAYEKFAWARAELKGLLSDEEWAAAARNTLNAHYTDAAYVKAIWSAVRGLGFAGGRVLEPGCGSGNFIGCAPDGADMVGVELEPVTAGIAQAVYPHAQVRQESFADTDVPAGAFDLVVGNVPFGGFQLHDGRYNRPGHSIHNHFILKSLHLTRPGGYVAVLTSRYTLDAANPAARREMAELADLVGAVRLPTSAHRRAAGTDVVTDILLFRRRESERAHAGEAFERSSTIELGGQALRMNEYFVAHPEHVLGQLVLEQGDRGRPELGVKVELEGSRVLLADHQVRITSTALERVLGGIAASARERDLAFAPASPGPMAPVPVARVGNSRLVEGRIEARPDGTFTMVENGQVVPYAPPATQAGELRQLLGLRDTEVALLELEAGSLDSTPEMAALRAKLNAQYDTYRAEFGPINRFKERPTGRVDPETGEPGTARVSPGQGGFRKDPFSATVYALELFDDSEQTSKKAPIFRDRVVARRDARLGADSPADALAICLDTVGEVRLPEIARLLGVSEKEAREELGNLVFDEPGTDRLVTAAEYLSGNVRIKLQVAKTAAAEDARFAANVAALTGAQPRDLGPDEIEAQLGAAWIHEKYVQRFLAETLDDPTVRVEHPGAAIWTVKSHMRSNVRANTEWGTERVSAYDLAEHLLEQREIKVVDIDSEGNRHPNAEATTAAQDKATEIAARFREWVWEEPRRAAELARTYNDTFNCIVPRSYDGASLTLPGLALNWAPRPHQMAAVARIIQEPAVGLFHEVGAGKTAEMVIGAMELRRLGLAQKPCVVVPNHMLEQFTREWMQLYPQAKVLAASSDDLTRDRRMRFAAQCATGDWDGIIITRSAFERLAMSPGAQKRYLEREVASLGAMLARAQDNGTSRRTLKTVEKLKLKAEERLKAKLDSDKDPGVTFEQTGIDYIFADEAHAYKNLRTASHIQGMSIDGSKRAQDLDMKLGYLRERGGRVATLATATPIPNSIREAFTMQRYLRPDLLEQAGVQDFDVWAATFGSTVTGIEVAPDGGGMRVATRFAKFRNVPELLQLWRVSADIKTAEDLRLPVPPMAVREDGTRAPRTVVVPASEELKSYVKELAARAEQVRSRQVDPSEDNLLKISTDGRAAGLDLRLVGGSTRSSQKVEVAADRIAQIHADHRHDRFPEPDDPAEMHPTPGALQLVFADLGTPSTNRWNVYDELRNQLVARGVPAESIRFMHEASTDREKGELFSACRAGRVSVLIGSTERMGVGTNVQLRAVALHHLDCPWRPSDVAQREGRILRQGNACPEVQLYRYVSEGSFDAYIWQTVTRKAQFIAQVMRGRLDVREIEDIGEAALSYNEVKALATGNPLLLEHAQAHAEVTRLERLERSFVSSRNMLRITGRDAETRAGKLDLQVGALDAAIEARNKAPVEPFAITIRDRLFMQKDEANSELRSLLTTQFGRWSTPDGPVAQFRGLPIHIESVDRDPRGDPQRVVLRVGSPKTGANIEVAAADLGKANLVQRLENKVGSLEAARTAAEVESKRLRTEVMRAADELEKPFKHRAALDEGRVRLKDLDEKLAESIRVPGPMERMLYQSVEEQARRRHLPEDQLTQVVVAARERLVATGKHTGLDLETLATQALDRLEPERLPGPLESRLYKAIEEQFRRRGVSGAPVVEAIAASRARLVASSRQGCVSIETLASTYLDSLESRSRSVAERAVPAGPER